MPRAESTLKRFGTAKIVSGFDKKNRKKIAFANGKKGIGRSAYG